MTEFYTQLDRLNETIRGRQAAGAAEKSYTAQLLSAGPERCAKKFGEEAVELIIAATAQGKEATIAEAADVIYHFLVLLRAAGIDVNDVAAELARRETQSGLEEKAGRS